MKVIFLIVLAVLGTYCVVALFAVGADAAPAGPSAPERCAVKALRGDFGVLKPWQAEAYGRIVEGRYRPIQMSLTRYQPRPVGWKRSPRPWGSPEWHDQQCGGPSVDRKGRRLVDGDLAGAYPYGTVIWVDEQLRHVTDAFGSPKPKHRFDVCRLKADDYLSQRTGWMTGYVVQG
jgi:hypothetical protein